MCATSVCLLDDGARQDVVALAVGGSCGVPVGEEPAGASVSPSAPRRAYQ